MTDRIKRVALQEMVWRKDVISVWGLFIMKGGQEICIGSIEDCAMLKSHFYKGAEIRVKGDNVRLEVRDLSNMTVPPHEMEFVPLLNRKEKKK